MENNDEIIDSGINTDENLAFSGFAKQYLLETAKWAKFLSIMGFIFIGFIVIIALFAGSIVAAASQQSQLPFGMAEGAITVVYLLIALFYFFPVYYLFLFANNAKKAILSNNNSLIELSLEKLKSHYKFLGITTIVVMAFYAIAFIIALSMGAAF